jgi:hypothetical protein
MEYHKELLEKIAKFEYAYCHKPKIIVIGQIAYDQLLNELMQFNNHQKDLCFLDDCTTFYGIELIHTHKPYVLEVY